MCCETLIDLCLFNYLLDTSCTQSKEMKNMSCVEKCTELTLELYSKIVR